MVVTKKDRANRIDKRIVDQKNYKSNFTKTEKADVDIWELHFKEREQMLTKLAEYRQKKNIRDWIELILLLGFMFYMLYDIYKDGDFDTIIKFLTA